MFVVTLCGVTMVIIFYIECSRRATWPYACVSIAPLAQITMGVWCTKAKKAYIYAEWRRPPKCTCILHAYTYIDACKVYLWDVCMCACMYVCMYVPLGCSSGMHVYANARKAPVLMPHTNICRYACAGAHVCMYVCMHVCMFVCMYINI